MDLVDLVITADTVNKTKPDPKPLIYACERLGVEPSKEVVYIGDSIYDYLTASRAGLDFIGVTWGVHPDKLKEKSNISTATSPKELLRKLGID